MFEKLISTDDEISSLILRVLLGIVFFAHGAQKMLGWYGGSGFSGTMDTLTQGLAIPAVLAFLAIAAEFFGSLGLILGLLTRVAAFGIGCVMLVAVTLHYPHGFFMNWFKNQEGEGFEYHLLALAIVGALILKGAGRWSLDGMLSGRADDGA